MFGANPLVQGEIVYNEFTSIDGARGDDSVCVSSARSNLQLLAYQGVEVG